MKQILLIKTSSMGDLVHTFPAITDLQRHLGDKFSLTWVAEESFADIAAMHPATQTVIPVALRRWKRAIFKRDTWREFAHFKELIQQKSWDLVIDAQGLHKSAFLARHAKAPIHGYDRESAREGSAAFWYQYRYSVPWANQYNAVTRNRRLFAQILGYSIDHPADFGIPKWEANSPYKPKQPYAVLLHGTSAARKEWGESDWIELGRALNKKGLATLLFWGNDREHRRAQYLAEAIPNTIVAPKLSLKAIAPLLSGADLVVAVDTGLAHLANTQDRPIVTLFLDGPPSYAGPIPTAHNNHVINLGGKGAHPSVTEVYNAIESFNLF